MTTNVIVSDAVGASVLGSSGPSDERDERGDEEHGARRGPRGSTAARLVIGTFGSRGGRCMTSGSPGSTAMTTTPAAVTKKSRYSTISGVSATPSLMSNARRGDEQHHQRQQLGHLVADVGDDLVVDAAADLDRVHERAEVVVGEDHPRRPAW